VIAKHTVISRLCCKMQSSYHITVKRLVHVSFLYGAYAGHVVRYHTVLRAKHTFSLCKVERTFSSQLSQAEPGIERVQALSDISRSGYVVIATKPNCAPIANPPNSAQLEGTPYHSPSYIRVRAVVWACGDGHARTHERTHTHTQRRT